VESPIRSHPEILGGEPCFTGTRVPVEALFDYLKAGRSIDFFLQQYPTVTRQKVEPVVDATFRSALECA
jgi:uncharacterized protein (DUF433 family)